MLSAWLHMGVRPLPCVQIHISVSINPHFLNEIFLLEKKGVIYEKALDSLMVFSVWILSVLRFHSSQKGPAGPAASSEWEEKKLGWCLPQAACAWVAEAARSEVQVQPGHMERLHLKRAERKKKRPLFCFSGCVLVRSRVAHETLVFHVTVTGKKVACYVMDLIMSLAFSFGSGVKKNNSAYKSFLLRKRSNDVLCSIIWHFNIFKLCACIFIKA